MDKIETQVSENQLETESFAKLYAAAIESTRPTKETDLDKIKGK